MIRCEPTHEEETVTSESPILNVLVKIKPIERARQSVPASRAEGELQQQGWEVCGVVSSYERTKKVLSEPPRSNAEINMLTKERARQSVPTSRAAGALHRSGQAV